MFTRLRQLLVTPPNLEANQARTATLLATILWASIAVCVGYAGIVLLFEPRAIDVVFVSSMCLVLLALVVAVRRGHVVAASWIFSIGAWVGLLLATYVFGGVRSSSYGALLLTVIIAGILLSGRATVILAAFSIGFGWMMMQAELAGWYQPNPEHLSLFNTWIGQALSFVVAAVLLGLTVRGMQQALALARESQEALVHSNLTLQVRTLELERERSALQQERDFVARLMDTSPAGILRVDRTGQINFANVTAERILGLPRSEITRRTYDAPDWHNMDLAGAPLSVDQLPVARVMATGQALYGVQHNIEWPDHRRVVLSVNAAPIFNEAGHLEGVVATVEDITARIEAEQLLNRQARQLQAAAEVSRAVASILDLSVLLPRVVELMKAGFDLYYAGLFLSDELGQRVALRAATGTAGRRMLELNYQISIDGQSMIGWCVTHRAARIALDVGADSVRFDNPLLPATRSEMALPLLSRGRVIGAMTIQSDRPAAFTTADAAVLQTMADQVAIAIDNAQLFEAEKHTTALMTALRDIGLVLSSELDLPTLLQTIVQRAAQFLDAPMGELLLLQPNGMALAEAASFNAPPNRQPIPLGEGVSGRVAQSGRFLIVEDYGHWPGRYWPLGEVGYRSVLGVPIQQQDRVIGVLNLLDGRPARFNRTDANMLQLFAMQAAVALENAKLFDTIRQRLDDLSVLHAVALTVTEATAVEELVNRAMEIIGQILYPDYAGVLLRDPVSNRLHGRLYQVGVYVPMETPDLSEGQGVISRVIATGQAWLIPDVQLEPAYYALNLDVLSELCVPMRVGDRIIGAINIESRRVNAFTTADEQLLSTIAGQLSSAIERLRAEAARRENEEALAQERNLLRTLIDNLPEVSVFVKDAQSRFLTTNAAHLKLLSLNHIDEVIGKTDFDLLPREFAEQHYADEQAVLQAGLPLLNREEPVLAYDGRVHWYLTHKVPLRDRQERIVGLVGMSLDITVRKHAEEREQAIARGLQGVVEATDELIGVVDLTQFYRRAVELAREKLQVERCGIFLLETESDQLRGTFGTNLDGQTVDEQANVISTDMHRQLMLPDAPLWLKREDRYQYWDGMTDHREAMGWIAATSIRSGDQSIGVFFNDNAISHTPLDAARQEVIVIYCSLLGSMLELKRVTQERESLIEELETKNAELERFTYTVSHDLKSPLITIRGFLGFLEQDAASGNLERLHADIRRIADATDRMQHLLNDLLELSRVGRIMNDPEDVPFEEIAREAAALVEGRIMVRGVRVTIASGLPHVFGDRARLLEVMQNLVDNAVKFVGDQPEPLVEIGVRYDNAQPVFFVKDNGIGIDPRYQQKIFGLFDKLDPKSEGTGVGLALVKRIITVHGGRVWIESAGLGAGTTFCFTLPEATRA
jgi:PAS domain S-box-containing protein